MAGAAILSGPLATPGAVVAWVSLVVGVHFLALAAIWELSVFRFLGTAGRGADPRRAGSPPAR